jgi:DNA-binding response OmpR family regulator
MRVLVVEDEQLLADALVRGLGREGFAVDAAANGVDGLHQARETPYDVIVCDVMLPGIDGLEIVRSLRAGGVWTPVLMLTAKDADTDVAGALDLGADDYLVKPFSFTVLVSRVRALIRRGAPERPPVLQSGDLTLDPATRRCSRAGRDVALTPREFALLEFLMRRPEEVLSKTQIVEHVWDAHYDGDPNIVEVYVGYLRRKIDAPFRRQTIETVRGAGYRLRADGG